jgi:hypothetical protein
MFVAMTLLLLTTTHAQVPLSASALRPGSLLFYSISTSDVGNPNLQNTRLNITNTATVPVIVHWFFIENRNCQVADLFTCLTGNQTMSFFASDYDPGVTGFAVAVAVNEQGLPRDFNFLIGSEYVKFMSGHEANLLAEPMTIFNHARSYAVVGGSGSSQVDLIFDDEGYEKLPSELAVNNIPSALDQNQTMLIINRIGGDLGDQVATIGGLNGLLYNQAEKGFSFTLRANGCQLIQTLSDGFPRTAPSFTKVIPMGSSGWMRLFTADKVDNTPQGTANDPRAILGAMINLNSLGPHSKGFNQGHNLHRLIKAPVTKLRMPVIPPAGC